MKIKSISLKKSVIVLLIVLFAMPAVSMARGYGKFGHEGGSYGFMGPMTHPGLWRNPEVIKQLGLSDKQVEKIKEIEFDAKEQQLELRSQLQRERLEMEKLMSADKLDDSAIVKQAKKISDFRGKAFVQMVENHLKTRAQLNDEQQQKLKSLKTQFFQKGHHMMGERPFTGKR